MKLEQSSSSDGTATRKPLHLLSLVTDVLHTDKYHRGNSARPGVFGGESKCFTPTLVELASSCIRDRESHEGKTLKSLLNYWAVNKLIPTEDLQTLKDKAAGGTKARHYLLPDYHGYASVAERCNLPAAYMLEPMIRHPERPIDRNELKVPKFDSKPASPRVRKLLDNFFENIDLKYEPTADNPSGETSKYNLWLDPMGQLVKRDKATGDTSVVCNGYGWSAKFCQDMQKHGLPGTIKIAREDMARMEEDEQVREPPQRRHDEQRHSSPRRQREFIEGQRSRRGRRDSRSRSRSRSGYRSDSSYDSRYSRSRSRDRHYNHRHDSSKSHEPARRDENPQGRPPPNMSNRAPHQPGSKWPLQGNSRDNASTYPPSFGSQNYGPGFVPPPPPSIPPNFSMPPFPPPHLAGTFPFPQGQFPPQMRLAGFPPPPPQLSGFPPPPPNIGPFGGQHGDQQGFNCVQRGGYSSHSPGSRSNHNSNNRGGGYGNGGGSGHARERF